MIKRKALINWKVVFIFVLLMAFIGVIIYITTFYRTLVDSKVENQTTITSFITKSNLLTSIDEIYDVQAEERFYILQGVDSKNIEQLVFVPYKDDLKKAEILTFKTNDLKKQADIEASWQSECEACLLKKSNPSMIDEKPLWELAYLDASDRYVIQYISLKDGKTYEQLTFNKKYK